MTEVRDEENSVANPQSNSIATRKSAFSRFSMWVMPALIFLYAKGKVVLIFAMKSAFLAPVFSFLLSLASYGIFMGWLAGLGLMVQLLVHEFGHYIAAKLLKVRVSLPKFMPFMGAWVEHDDPRSDYENAIIALSGPTAGIALSGVCLLGWYATASQPHFLLWMAMIGLLLNLGNLIPVNPLDGGHVVSKFSPRLTEYALLALAFFLPASGEQQLTLMFLIIAFTSGHSSNKIMNGSICAGFTVAAMLWSVNYMLPAAGFFVLAFFDVEGFVSRAAEKFFGLIFGRSSSGTSAVQTRNEKREEAMRKAIAALPAVSPLSIPQRCAVGIWYAGLLLTGCPVAYWLVKLPALHMLH